MQEYGERAMGYSDDLVVRGPVRVQPIHPGDSFFVGQHDFAVFVLIQGMPVAFIYPENRSDSVIDNITGKGETE